MEQEISAHRSSIYLRFPINFVEQRVPSAEIHRIGATTRRLRHQAGIVGSWPLRGSDGSGSSHRKIHFDWYCAVVMLLADEDGTITRVECTTSDCRTPRSKSGSRSWNAANLLNKFNYWRIIEQRELHSGRIVQPGRIKQKLSGLRLMPDELNPENDLFHNPHGLWHLEAIRARL